MDPNFAPAYDAMGLEYQYIGAARAVENIRKAFELRSRVSERERLIIEGDYYGTVTGDDVKSRQSWKHGGNNPGADTNPLEDQEDPVERVEVA